MEFGSIQQSDSDDIERKETVPVSETSSSEDSTLASLINEIRGMRRENTKQFEKLTLDIKSIKNDYKNQEK